MNEIPYRTGEIHPTEYCTLCGCELVLRLGKHGLFWGCKAYPDCLGTVGTDPETFEPKGSMVDEETHLARTQFREALWNLWHRSLMSRKQAYFWLSHELKLSAHALRYARLSKEQCERAIVLIDRKAAELYRKLEQGEDEDASEDDTTEEGTASGGDPL